MTIPALPAASVTIWWTLPLVMGQNWASLGRAEPLYQLMELGHQGGAEGHHPPLSPFSDYLRRPAGVRAYQVHRTKPQSLRDAQSAVVEGGDEQSVPLAGLRCASSFFYEAADGLDVQVGDGLGGSLLGFPEGGEVSSGKSHGATASNESPQVYSFPGFPCQPRVSLRV